MPILQGVSVGGSTTINGSIMQDLEENFCNRIIQKLDTKNKNFRFDNLLNYQKEIYNEFNIESGSKEFLHNNKLIEEIKRKNWKCELSKRAISDKNYEGRTLSGNSVENVILRKYIGSDIINNTDVKLIIKEEKKILGISCFNKLEKKNFFVKIKKKLIISCGVIESPKLLLKSKIKNKNLGKNFSCHLSGAVDALFVEDKKKT